MSDTGFVASGFIVVCLIAISFLIGARVGATSGERYGACFVALAVLKKEGISPEIPECSGVHRFWNR